MSRVLIGIFILSSIIIIACVKTAEAPMSPEDLGRLRSLEGCWRTYEKGIVNYDAHYLFKLEYEEILVYSVLDKDNRITLSLKGETFFVGRLKFNGREIHMVDQHGIKYNGIINEESNEIYWVINEGVPAGCPSCTDIVITQTIRHFQN